jgi:hypothetical protein
MRVGVDLPALLQAKWADTARATTRETAALHVLYGVTQKELETVCGLVHVVAAQDAP